MLIAEPAKRNSRIMFLHLMTSQPLKTNVTYLYNKHLRNGGETIKQASYPICYLYLLLTFCPSWIFPDMKSAAFPGIRGFSLLSYPVYKLCILQIISQQYFSYFNFMKTKGRIHTDHWGKCRTQKEVGEEANWFKAWFIPRGHCCHKGINQRLTLLMISSISFTWWYLTHHQDQLCHDNDCLILLLHLLYCCLMVSLLLRWSTMCFCFQPKSLWCKWKVSNNWTKLPRPVEEKKFFFYFCGFYASSFFITNYCLDIGTQKQPVESYLVD